MAQSERLTSKNVYIAFAKAGEVAVDLSGDYNDFSWSAEVAAIDVTTNNDTAVYEKPGTKKYGYELKAYYRGAAGSAIYAKLIEGNQGTITWGPNGTAAGQPKGIAPVYVQKVDWASGSNDSAQELSVTFGPQGALVSDPRTTTF